MTLSTGTNLSDFYAGTSTTEGRIYSVTTTIQHVQYSQWFDYFNNYNRTICLLTWSDTAHHHAYNVNKYVYLKVKIEKCGNTKKKKKQTHKKIRKQKYDHFRYNEC